MDAGKKILKHTNWVFLDGKAHVDYRKGLNGLFTRKALADYIPGQEEVYDKAFESWLEATDNGAKHIPFFQLFREINVAVSCRTFCGDYITDEAVKEISANYWRITAAMELVNFPIVLPFTKLWYGIKARKIVVREFERCVAKSRVRMLNKEPITCMIDAWIREMIDAKEYNALPKEKKESEDAPAPVLIRDFGDTEIALTFLSFLFASQDATSSAITWLFQYVVDNPEVLEKVRAEQLAVRGGDRNKRLDLEMAEKMEYTRMVVKECLRMRPPVLMGMPCWLCNADYQFPMKQRKISLFRLIILYRRVLWSSLPYGLHCMTRQSTLIPTNSIPTDGPLMVSPNKTKSIIFILAETNGYRNWLVFGAGPHVCIGQNYAIMHLMMCLGKASLFLEWDHKTTPVSDNIRYLLILG